MSGFNTSARTGDMSMRLRAQNLRNARDQTKRLEDDNRKMEERLRELKTVMTKEKEERERQGGGFWGRGQAQVGSLTKYADEVLSSKTERPPREGKKKKIKVLQDEPIEVPKRSAQPGTMKYIAQRKLPPGPGPVPRDKQKGPRCGQCEDRGATLSCVQCSEIYCPGCFAAFHVKGALKQHRSVPISASGPRVCMSPHPSVDPQQSPRGSQASGSVVSQSASYGEGSGASSARQPPAPQVGASPTAGGSGSLLDGAYDESQSAASFQAALMAWREGPSTSPSASSNSSSPSKDSDRDRTARSKESRKVVASPIKSPVIAVDESTGTPEESRVPEIKFTSSLSYAERLLLKRHRRTELAEVATPRLGNQSPPRNGAGDQSQQMGVGYSSPWEERSGRPASGSRSTGSFSRRELPSRSGRRVQGQSQREDTFLDDGERVDFQSLLEAVRSSESPDQLSARRSHSSTSSVSITEVKSTYPTETPKFKTSTTYVVEEAKPIEAWNIEQSQISSATFVKDKSGHAFSTLSTTQQHPARNAITDLFPTENNSSHSNNSPSISGINHSTDARLKSAQRKKNQQLNSENKESLQGTPEPASPSFQGSSTRGQHFSGKPNLDYGAVSADGTESSASKTSKKEMRGKSAASSRPKSSAQSSRPGSRAQSRAASRMKVEGVLTKAPSSALKQVSQMIQSEEHTYTYQSPLEEFFLAGVEGQPPAPLEDRVLTPSKGRKPTSASRPKSRADGGTSAREEKFKISYKLYKMAPKSWRPDSSLGDTVPLSDVRIEDPQDEMVMSYSYSGQMTGQATEWRPSSSQSRMQFTSEDPGQDSSLVFGDEMFTEDASAAAAAALAGTASSAATPTPGSLSRIGLRPESSGRPTPSTPQNIHRHHRQVLNRDGSTRQSDDISRDDDITPTPSRVAARRKSANRRSFTPDNPDSIAGVYNSNNVTINNKPTADTSEAHQSSVDVHESVSASSENLTRRSATLRRIGGGSGRAHNRATSSPIPPSAMVPTPPPAPASATTTSGAAGAQSARSAQLSRRGLKTSSDLSSPTPPSHDLATPSGARPLSSTSARGDRGNGQSSRQSSSAKDGGNTYGSAACNPPSTQGVSKESTSLSRHSTRSSAGVRRHVSDVHLSSQHSDPHYRPASTSTKTVTSQRNQTPSQQWRPNSSTGGTDPAHKPETSLSASMEGRSHLHRDTVIADVLHSRVQADGWMDGEDDDDDDYDDNQGEFAGMAHNYDDGNDLDFVRILSQQGRRHGDQGDGTALRNSQHWQTEVHPFSGGRNSVNSVTAGGSLSHPAPAGSSNGSGRHGVNSRLRSASSRPVSSMSVASGRESRAIVMDGEDLSMYDSVGAVPVEDNQDTEDRETLEKLEWELASDTGRLTADGQISRMSMLENDDDVGSNASSRSSAKSLRKSAERDYDVSAKLLEDEQHAQEEVDEFDMRRSVTLDEDEVKALR